MKTAVVHMGVHKTGTTAIQHWIGDNRMALARAGLKIPDIREDHNYNYFALAEALCVPANDRSIEQKQVVRSFSDWLDGQDGNDILISTEYLDMAMNRQKMTPFVKFFERHDYTVRAVVFLRNPADQLNSSYAQQIKSLRVFKWQPKLTPNSRGLLRWHHSLNYLKNLGTDLRVSVYPPREGNAALIEDFADLAGIKDRINGSVPLSVPKKNDSLGVLGLIAAGHLCQTFAPFDHALRLRLTAALRNEASSVNDRPANLLSAHFRKNIRDVFAPVLEGLEDKLSPQDFEKLQVSRSAKLPSCPDSFEELDAQDQQTVREMLGRIAEAMSRTKEFADIAPGDKICGIGRTPFSLRNIVTEERKKKQRAT